MQDLRVIGVENGALLVASDEGQRFRIPIDEVLQSRLRQSLPEPSTGRKISPRDIQAHIRSGMSAEDVAAVTGVAVDYIQRFEGPVLAEREFVVESALGVRVQAASEPDVFTPGLTFGIVIRERLAGLGATGERWSSWKEQDSGWIVKLSFTADDIDHDARWGFDPKKLSLSPLNNEAITLSQQGEPPSALIPRLRAVSGEREPDRSRFDSGAFDLSEDSGPAVTTIADPTGGHYTHTAATSPVQDSNQTADLLEALRRRRGEREAASFSDDGDDVSLPAPSGRGGSASVSSTGGIRLVDVPLDDFLIDPSADSDDEHRTTAPQPVVQRARKGRAAMPSWDDIVFGARTDDDPA